VVVVLGCSLADVDHTRYLLDLLIILKTGFKITLFCSIVRNDVPRVKRSMCNIQVSGNHRILLNKNNSNIRI